MTTQIDVLNAQIADAQVRILAANASNVLTVARINKQITDWQANLADLQNPPT